jgi:biopolymer transport protein ExbD
MKLKRNRRFGAEVATAALNDIMFFLLLFFLILSTVANPNVIKLMLPRASVAQSLQKQQVQLSITKDKEYYINQKVVPFESLESSLLNACKQIAEPTVIVRADYSLSIQDLVNVLQIGTKLKLKMVLATDKSK